MSLKMTGLRDDGYHLIDAEMVSIDLHDVVTVTPGSSGITVSGPYANGVPTDETNLVARVLATADLGLGDVGVHIEKNIPHGGGLGGGSTDGAAIARWISPDLDPLTVRGVRKLAALSAIGADIPFCVVGGRARVRGIGEIIDPLPHIDRDITLVIPPLSVSTPAAYRAWDELGGPTGSGPNDLEPAAIMVEPRLAWWRDAITERAGVDAVLAGSGATFFIEGHHFSEGVDAEGRRANALADLVDKGARIVATRTVGTS